MTIPKKDSWDISLKVSRDVLICAGSFKGWEGPVDGSDGAPSFALFELDVAGFDCLSQAL